MNKKIILAIVAIVAVIAIGVIAFSLGIFGETTEIDTKFLSGTIQGEAVENNTTITLPGWEAYYHDEENRIKYEFIMADSLNLTKGLFINVAGLEKIATEEHNGVKWDIYYLDTDSEKYKEYADIINDTDYVSGYVCFASGNSGEYCIIISSNNLNSDNSLNSDLFKNYVEPLLGSTTLKDPKNAPTEYQLFKMPKEAYEYIQEYIEKNGWDGLINMIT